MTGREWIVGVSETLQDLIELNEKDKERYETLEADLITAGGIQYTADRVQTSMDDKLLIKYDTFITLGEIIDGRERQINNFRRRSINKIEDMIKEPTLCRCLVLRHIDFKTNKEIAKEIGVTDRHVIRKLNKSYDLLNSIYILEKYRKNCEKFDRSPQKVLV